MTGTPAQNILTIELMLPVAVLAEAQPFSSSNNESRVLFFVGSWTVWSNAIAVEGAMLALLWPIGHAVPIVVTAVSVSPAPVAKNIEPVSAVSVAPAPWPNTSRQRLPCQSPQRPRSRTSSQRLPCRVRQCQWSSTSRQRLPRWTRQCRVLEHIEPAPAVSYMTPAPTVCRVLERRMK